jgi:hypothetical protein
MQLRRWIAGDLAGLLHDVPVSEAAEPRRGANPGTRRSEKTMTKPVGFALALALTLGAAFLIPAAAQAKGDDRGDKNDKGCKSSFDKDQDCGKSQKVPEPGDLLLLSSGLATLSVLSLVRRKSVSK